MTIALANVFGFNPISFAVVGAPDFFSVLTISFQFCPCNFAIIMEPMPHFSPCNPIPNSKWSIACENRCSAPEQGLLLPAIHDATPALINASTITLTSMFFFEKFSALSISISALIEARFAEYLP